MIRDWIDWFRTEYRLAPLGRRELARYLNHMEALIRATRSTLGH